MGNGSFSKITNHIPFVGVGLLIAPRCWRMKRAPSSRSHAVEEQMRCCQLLLVGSLNCRFRIPQKIQLSASILSYVLPSLLVLFITSFCQKKFLSITVQRAVFVLQVHSLTAHKVRHFIWALLSFSLIFFEVRESRRGGNLDLQPKVVNVISEWAGRAFCIVAFVVSFIYIESCMVLLKKIVEGGELLCNNIIT